jgi:hypothetical protein
VRRTKGQGGVVVRKSIPTTTGTSGFRDVRGVVVLRSIFVQEGR